jgi:hypothetical protein
MVKASPVERLSHGQLPNLREKVEQYSASRLSHLPNLREMAIRAEGL